MRIIETKVYTINEHPDKEKCFEWIRNNWWTTLNQHSVDEVQESIKALSARIGGTFDYAISQSPDQGEFIYFEDYDKEELFSLNADDCPLTGVYWDIDLINGLKEGDAERVLDSLHADTEYHYSNEGLQEFCEANEYEFDEDGTFVS